MSAGREQQVGAIQAAVALAVVATVVAALAAALAIGAAPAAAHGPSHKAPTHRDPKHPCKTRKLKHLDKSGACTHGADPAPAGFEVARDVAPVGDAEAQTATAGCDGDGTSGARVQVVYFRASDKPDRFATYLQSFRTWAAAADTIVSDSAAQTGGARSIRFVHDASCTIDVLHVVGGTTSDDDFDRTIAAMQAAGHSRTDRKYMIFVDANVYCGIGTVQDDDQVSSANLNNAGPSYGRTDTGCWDGEVAAHELVHNLGGVQLTAPHASGGWHCVDEWDRMCYSDEPAYPAMQVLCPDTAIDRLLDCGDDDYFSTAPPTGSYLATHWNVANSQFLVGATAPPPTCPDAAIEASGDATAAAARTILAGTTEARAFCAAGDQDWYAFTGTAGTPVVLETLALGRRTDTVLRLYAADGSTQLAVNDDSGTSYASRIAFTPQTTGTYKAKVVDFSGSGSPGLTYSLRLDTSPSSCPDAATEPDDVAAQARTLAVGSTASRAFCRTADADWVAVGLTAGTTYRMQTLGLTGGNDTVLALFAPDGTTQLAESDDVGGDPRSQLDFRPATSGTYRLRATRHGGDASAGFGYGLRVSTGDLTAPAVTSRAPLADATGASLTGTVTATFSEAVDGVGTATFALRDAAGAVVPAAVRRNGTTNQWVLDPDASLAADARYTVTLTGGTSAIRDLAGNPLATTSWQFTTGPLPSITGRSPAASATKVSQAANVGVTFSEPVQGVTTATLRLLDPSGAVVPAALARTGTTNQWVLDPSASLPADTRFTVSVTGGAAGVRDLAGNPLTSASWSFLTGPAPAITGRSPASGATAVAGGARVSVTFSEPVLGVSASTLRLRDPSLSYVAATVTRVGTTNEWVLEPAAALAPDTRYVVVVTGGATAVRDLAGNALTSTSWAFVTGPAPAVASVAPAADATGVARTAAVSAAFTEAVTGVSTSTFRLRTAATGSAVSATVARDDSTGEWVLDPAATLAAGTRYTATLTGGTTAIRDLAGNPLATRTWTFTTGAS